VTYYAQDSADHGIRSIFDYYMLLQSQPAIGANEGAKDFNNLNNEATMRAYFADLKLFFMRVAPFAPGSVVLHFEPDLWGFFSSDRPATTRRPVSARVGATGVSELAGLPDNAAGLARAVLRLRDQYAPGVLVAYHLSVWGTGNDILYSDPSDATVDSLAVRAANFYTSLGTSFDLVFTDPSDRDAGFKQYNYGDGGASWWSDSDYAAQHSLRRAIQRRDREAGGPVAGPDGQHEDARHEQQLGSLPGQPRRVVPRGSRAARISARSPTRVSSRSCSVEARRSDLPRCDSANDGVTDPPAINGNTRASLSADDDGGYFRSVAAAYYAGGALALPGGAVPSPTPAPSPTAAPSSTPAPSPTADPDSIPSARRVRIVGRTRIPPPDGVAVGMPGLHAAWYGQSGYPTLCAGQRSTAVVAFFNSGSQVWVSGRMGEVAYLGTWGPEPGQDRASPLGGDGQFGSPDTGWPRYDRIAVQPAPYVGPGRWRGSSSRSRRPALPASTGCICVRSSRAPRGWRLRSVLGRSS
jgi:hypothetical protein